MNILKNIVLVVLALASTTFAFCQDIKRNNNWAIGFEPVVILDFNNTTVQTSKVLNNNTTGPFCALNSSSAISNINGNLELISNGFIIYNKNGYPVKNGLYINCPYGDTLFETYCQGYSHFDQTSIILPKKGNQYYVFCTGMSDSVYMNYANHTWTEFDVLNYSVVDMDSNAGKGEVIAKNVILTEDQHYTNTALTAVRHGNNKDWWLMKADCVNNRYQFFLVKEDTIIGPMYQTMPSNAIGGFCVYLFSQNYFSDDGTKMISSMYGNLEIQNGDTFYNFNRMDVYDFDRNNGVLTYKNNYIVPLDTITYPNWDIRAGVQFSPNGKLAYMSNNYTIYQVDIEDTNRYNATFIHGPDTTINDFPWYNLMANAPNGKLYIGNYGGSRNSMSYIDKPNIKGLGCDFIPQGFSQPYNANLKSPPNMPNYGLGQWPLSNYEAVLENKQLLVYPVPASDLVTIEYVAENNERPEIMVYDLLGNKIMSQLLDVKTTKTTLNVEALSRGIYTYKVIGCSNTNYTGKLILE